jgi:hypothetical protein
MPDFDNTAPVARDLSAPYSNTAPTSRSPGTYTPDNGAAVAVAIDQTPANTQPGTRNLATPYDDTAAAARDLAAPASNTAPDSRSPGTYTPDNGAPGARDLAAPHSNVAPGSRDLAAPADNTAAVAKAIDQTPANADATAKSIGDYGPTNGDAASASPGSFTPLNEAPQYRGTLSPKPLTDENVNTPTILLEGALVLNRTYGHTRIPQLTLLERVQVQLQEPPVGGPATIILVDAAGNPYGVSVTVLAGEVFGETICNPQVQLNAAANVRAKVTQVGATEPGGFGAVTLFARVATA